MAAKMSAPRGKARPLPVQPHTSPAPSSTASSAPGTRAVNAVMLTKPLPRLAKKSKKPDTNLRGSSLKVLPNISGMCERFDRMLEGHTDNLPPKPPTEVRIFLSSTFSDMRVERNYLMKEAYPMLKAYCYNELDLDFRVVDMRWGVTDDATNEHVTEELCLREIHNCQRLSLGPNFVSVLGDRYGYRPLPSTLPVSEFTLIEQEARVQDHPRVGLLERWYRRDDNAVPPQYVLQPITSQIPHFGARGGEAGAARAERARQEWWDTADVLVTIVRRAVDALHRRGAISADRRHDFYKSVTEFEVCDGVLRAPTPNDHTFCLIRRFTDITNDVAATDKSVSRFIEVVNKHGQKVVDEDVKSLRTSLQEEKIPRVLSAAQIGVFEVPWSPGGIHPETIPAHREYINAFCKGFTNAVLGQINAAKDAKDNQIPVSEYFSDFDETLHHLLFVEKKTALFRGQKDVLNKVRTFLLNKNKRSPLVLHAASGGGKTSLMATIFQQVPTWLGSECVRLVRFLGTSPASTDIHAVLVSLVGQLADNYDQIPDPSQYRNHKAMVKFLPRFIRTIARKAIKEHIVILLDSIDQLFAKDGAYLLKWLPLELPANVHIVISTIPNHGDILANAKKLIADKDAFIEVLSLPQSTSTDIVDAHLHTHRRTLTEGQRELVMDRISKVASPLYVKLVMDQAVSWRSYTDMGTVTVGATVRAAIWQLFSALEAKFGSTLVRHALGYITVGLSGLSEAEVEDALSCDDEVLDEVYQYHSPPVDGVVTIPPMLWARIRHDVSEYLVERQSQHKTTLFWYHRQFVEVAEERFTAGDQGRALHGRLAQMYMAEKGVRRDITLTHRGLTIPAADRQVSQQPLSFRNVRKLAALPYHLRRSAQWHTLKSAALCNLPFMMTKITASGLSSLLADYELDEEVSDPELTLVSQVLGEIRATSWRSVQLLPGEILARVHDQEEFPHVSRLLQECRTALMVQKNTLLPMYPCLSSTLLLKAAVPQVTAIHNHSLNHRRLVVQDNTGSEEGGCRLIDIDRNADVSLSVIGSLIAPLLSKDGENVYFVQSQRKMIPAAKKGQKKRQEINIMVVMAQVDSLIRKDRIELTECLTVQVDPSELPSGTMDMRINAIDADRTGKYVAMVFGEKYLVVKDVEQQSHPGIMNTLHIKGDRGLESTTKMSRILFTSNSDKVITLVGSAEEGTLWTSVNVQGVEDKKLKSFHVPGIAWFDEVKLLQNDAVLFLAVKAGDVTRLGLVDLKDDAFAVDYLKLELSVLDIATGSLDKPKLYVASHDSVYIYDVTSRRREQMLKLPDGELLKCITVQEDEEMVFCGSQQGFVHIWRSENWNYIGKIKVDMGIRLIYSSVDDEHLLTLSPQGNLKVWQQEAAIEFAKTSTDSEEGSAEKLSLCETAANLSFIPDSEFLVTDHGDCLKLWDYNDDRCGSVIQKAPHHCFAVDDMIFDDSGLLYCLNRTTHFKLAIYDLERKVTVEISQLNHLAKVLAICMETERGGLLYLCCVDDGVVKLVVFDPIAREVVNTIPVQSRNIFQTDDIELLVTSGARYVVFKTRCTAKELAIIVDAERKGNLKHSESNYKFSALDMENPANELVLCYRQLTRIPCLGSSMAVVDDKSILIGRERVTLYWDISTGSCDSKLVKGTKTPQYFRPIWIEHDDDWGTLCYGPINSMHRNTSPASSAGEGSVVTALGSDDGWVMVYDASGQSVNPDPGTRSSHGKSPVKLVRVSPTNEWVVSVSADTVFKCWAVSHKGKEMFSLKLNMRPLGLQFSSAGDVVAVLGRKANGANRIALFKVIGN